MLDLGQNFGCGGREHDPGGKMLHRADKSGARSPEYRYESAKDHRSERDQRIDYRLHVIFRSDRLHVASLRRLERGKKRSPIG